MGTNSLVVGETQQGKSTLVLNEDILPTVKARKSALFIFDPHDTMNERVEEFCVTMNQATNRKGDAVVPRLIVDRLDDMHHVCSFGLLQRSKNSDPEDRLFDHTMITEDFLELLGSYRKDYDVNSSPNTKKYGYAVILGWLENDHDIPLELLPYGLMPPQNRKQRDSHYHRFLSGVRDPMARHDLASLEPMGDRSRMDEAGGALRLLWDMWRDLPARKRMQPNLDLKQFIKDKGVYCLSGGRASRRSKQVVMRLIAQLVIRQMTNDYFAFERDKEAKIYFDEAANFGLVGMPEATAMGQTTKMKLTFTTITQAVNFGEEVTPVLFANTPRKIALKCASPTSRIMADQMRSTLDPMQEHYREQTTKQRHAGVEEVERTARRHDADGKIDGKTINVAAVPIYEDIVEERVHYVPVAAQDMLNEGKLQSHTRGNCTIISDGKVFTHQFKGWRDTGVWPGVGRRKADEHREWLKRIGVLRTPVIYEQPTWKPEEPKPKTGKSESPRTKKAPKGMG